MCVRGGCRNYARNRSILATLIVLVFTINCLLYYFKSSNRYKWASKHSNDWWLWPENKNWTIEMKTSGYDPSIHDKVRQNSTPLSLSNNTQQNKSGKKLILFIDPADFFMKDIFETCDRDCEITLDVGLHHKADAVVYHFTYMTDGKPLHPRSFPGQIYVWFCQESPWTLYHTYKVPLHKYDGLFNYTMTYRRDSDIYFPYYTLPEILQLKRLYKNKNELIAGKDSLATWVSGNCHTTKGAMQRTRMMLNFLKLGLKVDMYGRCAAKQLPGDLDEVILNHKFYFAMENALHCRDYITEKTWWNSLHAGAVPVIWGPTRQDLEAVLPSHSFILMEEFYSPEELVEYLNYLDSNPKSYAKYFEWMNDVRNNVTSSNLTDFGNRIPKDMKFCQLCGMLQNKNELRPNVVHSLHEWWYLRENKMCLTPTTEQERAKSIENSNLLKSHR